jgi:Fe-S cluster assembly protein SufB
MTTTNPSEIVSGYKFGWNDPDFKPVNTVRKGLSRDVVAQISEMKNEPEWMREYRLRALEIFESKPMPAGFWGGNIQGYPLDFNDIYYYVKPMEGQGKTWEEVPDQAHLRQAGHPRGRAQVPRRCRCAVRL